jgi:hypothetical protein
VWIFAAVGVLAATAFGAYSLLKGLDIKIPFLENMIAVEEVEAVDPGNVHISLPDKDISSVFVTNEKAGRLFVIQGKARNDYESIRNFIVVRASLYGGNGGELGQKKVYCGNVLSDEDLRALDKAAIEERMKNKFGQDRVNFRIPPGKTIPFSVVFADVPPDLGEFAVEVVSSLPAQ